MGVSIPVILTSRAGDFGGQEGVQRHSVSDPTDVIEEIHASFCAVRGRRPRNEHVRREAFKLAEYGIETADRINAAACAIARPRGEIDSRH